MHYSTYMYKNPLLLPLLLLLSLAPRTPRTRSIPFDARDARVSPKVQRPRVMSFEERVEAIEREKQAYEVKRAGLLVEEKAAARRRDYDKAEQCKKEIDAMSTALAI